MQFKEGQRVLCKGWDDSWGGRKVSDGWMREGGVSGTIGVLGFSTTFLPDNRPDTPLAEQIFTRCLDIELLLDYCGECGRVRD